MHRFFRTCLVAFALAVPFAAGAAVFADPPAPPAGDKKEEEKKKDPPKPSVTEHTVTIAGKAVKYRVTAGMQPLLDDKLKVKANVFNIAYERLVDGDEKDKDGKLVTVASKEVGKRPVTFAFNGGPGSSSVWLHLGALGPRKVAMGAEGERLPDTNLVDNPDGWLDFTDLVFIDPVSTGFSRPQDGEDPNQFHGLDEDVRSVGDFIRLYLTRSQRWLSPKYLCGESYGTTRAAGLSSDLSGRLGITLNGIVLVSPVLNFQTLSFDQGNDTAYWLFMPTYTATAFYHKKLAAPLDGDLAKALDEARAFAQGDYLAALSQGDALPAAKRDEVAARYAALTGLSVDYVKRAGLRITMDAFAKELLRDQRKTVGRYDSRYTGVDRNQNGTSPEYDPSYSAVQGSFTAALNAYIRGELGYESDQNYEILTGNVHPWNFPARNRYVNVSDSLRSAMAQNPGMRVLVVSGYYDLATPFFAATYTATHLGLDESVRKNITQTFYDAGHMVYLRQADLTKLRRDAEGFYGADKK
jgi:carboxypeptidase C (cathepsin A)